MHVSRNAILVISTWVLASPFALLPQEGRGSQLTGETVPLCQPSNHANPIFLAELYRDEVKNFKAQPEHKQRESSLVLDKTITETLGGGEVHTYELSLKANQFVRMAVTQHHIDTAQFLFGPDGEELAESDSLSGYEGTEEISWVAAVPGTYKLEVRCPDKFSSPGTYSLRMEELRASRPNDHTRVRAERLWMDSLKLYSKQTKESFNAVAGNLKELIPLWQELGDPAGEADALEMRASVESQNGAFETALVDFRHVVELRHQLGDSYGEISALHSVAMCHVGSHQFSNALEDLQRALTISTDLGDQAQLWGEMGSVQQELGQTDEEKKTYDRALQLYQRSEQHTEAIAPLLKISESLLAEKKYSLSDQFAQKALDIAKKFRDRPNEGRSDLLLARIAESRRNYDYAQSLYAAAARILLDSADERGRAQALAGYGQVCATLGDDNCAAYWLSQAIKIHEATKDYGSLLSSGTTLAEVLNKKGQEQAALKALGGLLKVADILQDKPDQARILNAMGVSETHLHQHEQALDSYQRALALRKETRDRNGEASTLSDLGDLYSEMGQLEQAHETFRTALQIFAEEKNLAGAAVLRQRWAGVYRKQKDYPKAAENLYLSIETYDNLRSTVGSDTNRMSFTAGLVSAPREMASLLAEIDSAGKYSVPPKLREKGDDLASVAFYFADRTKARGLADIMAGDISGTRVEVTSRIAVTAKNVPLHEHEILVEYLVQPEETLMWMIPQSGAAARMLKVPIGRDQLQSLIDQARPRPFVGRGVKVETESVGPKGASGPNLKVLEQLYNLLLSPALKETPSGTSVLVVPDGPLLLLPFEMWGHDTPAGWKWADSDFVFRYYYSAVMLAMLREAEMGGSPVGIVRKPKPNLQPKLLAFGDPDYSNSRETASPDRGQTRSAFEQAGYKIPPLPGTRVEVRDIGKVFGLASDSPDLRLASAATKSALKRLDKSGELGQYKYLHFATHGILADDVPAVGQPALILAGDSDSDGFLTMKEIQDLRVNADLVVLSACQTGLGKQITGEGAMGMARAFMVAGASSVVVSLWSVADESTAMLMQQFYTHLVKEHRGKGEALQLAREELRKQYPDPYFWAPFVLIGEDSALKPAPVSRAPNSASKAAEAHDVSLNQEEGKTSQNLNGQRSPTAAAQPEQSSPVGNPGTSSVQRFLAVHFALSSTMNWATDNCTGLMTLENRVLRYRAVKGTHPLHSFDIPLASIKEVKKNSFMGSAFQAFHVRLKTGENYDFALLDNTGQRLQSPATFLDAIHAAIAQTP